MPTCQYFTRYICIIIILYHIIGMVHELTYTEVCTELPKGNPMLISSGPSTPSSDSAKDTVSTPNTDLTAINGRYTSLLVISETDIIKKKKNKLPALSQNRVSYSQFELQ